MKKVVLLGVATAMAVSVSIAVFAGGKTEMQSQKNDVSVETSMQRRGPCTHAGCKCQKFVQRPGYYQCWCGHQSFVHK